MSDQQTCYVITGNLTEEGSVAYLRADETWAPTLVEANAFESKDEAEAVLQRASAAESVVTEPYLFDADMTDAGIVPRSARERIRSEGPTTRLRRPDAA